MNNKLYDESNKTLIINCIEELKDFKKNLQFNKVEILKYHGIDMIDQGDLPDNGNLKTIIFTYKRLSVSPKCIPFGVDTIEYPWNSTWIPTELSGLPYSVTCVRNVVTDCDLSNFIIPYHIRSISFSLSDRYKRQLSPHCLANGHLKSIEFEFGWNNDGRVLQVNDLPGDLESINLSKYDNDLLVGVIPSKVKELVIYHPLNHNIDKGMLPISLLSLDIGISKHRLAIPLFNEYSFPSNLTYINLSGTINNDNGKLLTFKKNVFPSTLKTLIIRADIKNKLLGAISFESGSFNLSSNQLTTLQILNGWNQYIGENDSITSILPLSLTYLQFGNLWNNSITHDFNKLLNLKELKFGLMFNKEIKPNSLPISIEKLTFGWSFNSKLSVNSIPCNVSTLQFGINSCCFTHPISNEIGILPSSLTSLSFFCNTNLNTLNSKNILLSSPHLKTLSISSNIKIDNFELLKSFVKNLKIVNPSNKL